MWCIHFQHESVYIDIIERKSPFETRDTLNCVYHVAGLRNPLGFCLLTYPGTPNATSITAVGKGQHSFKLKTNGPFVETSCVFQCIQNIINAEMWA